MKKFALLLAVVIILSVPMTAHAASRAMNIIPKLSFNGTTATCEATVLGDTTSDYIQVTMKLWNGNSCVATWNGSGYGYVHLNKTASVAKGITYDLTIDVVYKGVVKPTVTVTGTC